MIELHHTAYKDLNVPNIYFVYLKLMMILSIIAVAFYALIWLNYRHGGTIKICKKKKKKKTLLTDGVNIKIGEDVPVNKVDLGGRFQGFVVETSIDGGDSMASLD